ncbi:MAG: sialate O-acetylesterase [Treponema sp.]|nr:sialate O-acetylesterase [Treponema sp.]
MKRKILNIGILAAIILAVCITLSCDSTEDEPGSVEPVLHVYLCFGQSNMGGQAWNADGSYNYNGRVPDEYKKSIPDNFKVMASANFNPSGRTKGEWYKAEPPLCRTSNGLSPADYFGRYLAGRVKKGVTIGVIVLGVDGCKIEMFHKTDGAAYIAKPGLASYEKEQAALYGNDPYGRMVELAKKAMEEGELKGILMHQGESGADNGSWTAKVKQIYDDLHTDLELTEPLPFLAGQTVSINNSTINTLPSTLSNAHVISSSGCQAGSDNLHFSYEGYKTLGTRYGEKMFDLVYKGTNLAK